MSAGSEATGVGPRPAEKARAVALRWADTVAAAAEARPVLFLLAVLAAQTVATFWSRELWHIDSLRHGGVFWEMKNNGHWLALHLNGEPYPDKPPVYFWLLGAVSLLLGTQEAWIFFLVTAISAGAMLGATYALALATTRNRRVALLSGLLLLSNMFFIERVHYPRMDPAFAAFIATSLAAFYVAAGRRRAMAPMLLGFGAAAGAVLTKGPYGLLIPLATLVTFLLVRRDLRRLWSVDVAAGAALAAAVLGTYLGGLYLQGGGAFLGEMLGYVGEKSGESRGISFHLDDYLGMLLSRALPWTLLVLFLPILWPRLRRADDASRAGALWLALSVTVTLLALSFISYRHHFFLMMLLPSLAILAALAMNALPPRALTVLATAIGVALIAGGVVAPALYWMDPERMEIPYPPVMGVLAIVTGLAMLLVRRRDAVSVSATLALGLTLTVQPQFLALERLDRYFSTAAPGRMMAALAEDGYELMAYPSDYAKFFQFYAGQRIETADDWPALLQKARHADRVVIATRDRYWDPVAWRQDDARLIYATYRRMYLRVVAIDRTSGN